jgi:hypothetical protein
MKNYLLHRFLLVISLEKMEYCMKYQRASIVLMFFALGVFLSCSEQESASPQEIAAADAVVLPAAEIAEEMPLSVIQQESNEEPEKPREQAFTVFFEPVHYFQPLAADETLVTLQTDSTTTQILAISLERNTYRLIHELSGAPTWLSWFRSYNDSRSTFLRRGLRNDNSPAPFYHIDGENGVISHLFDVSTSFQISFDGRFVAFVPNYQANRNRVSLFSMEERDIVTQFEVTIDVQFPLEIAQEGRSNFRVFHPAGEWDSSNADGVLDTENLTLQMEERFGRFPMFEGDDLPTVPIILNAFPRLRYSLNLAPLPLPTPGRWLDASETVNVYSAPDFSSEVIQRVERLTPPLGAGTNFVLYEIGEEAIFDGISSHWAYVRLWHGTGLETGPTATTGWVFLGLMAY